MKYKNYYKTLDLRGPRATEEEIKIAFRKLAKKNHPDVVGNDERFKEINEAYQTLIDKKARKRYNIRYYAHIFQNGIDLSGFQGSAKRFANSEFVKIFIGEYTDIKENSKLKGNEGSLDDELSIKLTLEEAFLGATKEISYVREDGSDRTINVRIPRGATNGSKVLLRGEGRKNKFTGEEGDLYIKVSIITSKIFELKGNDLVKKVDITPSDAALGCELSVQSIDAVYKLKVPAGTQNGEIITIRDAGFINKDGKRGNLLAKVSIEVPKELTEAEKELYNKLKELQR